MGYFRLFGREFTLADFQPSACHFASDVLVLRAVIFVFDSVPGKSLFPALVFSGSAQATMPFECDERPLTLDLLPGSRARLDGVIAPLPPPRRSWASLG
jgi:hypothetical protein